MVSELCIGKIAPDFAAAIGKFCASTSAELPPGRRIDGATQTLEDIMGFGKGALLWLLGIPLPIIILLALFWR